MYQIEIEIFELYASYAAQIKQIFSVKTQIEICKAFLFQKLSKNKSRRIEEPSSEHVFFLFKMLILFISKNI